MGLSYAKDRDDAPTSLHVVIMNSHWAQRGTCASDANPDDWFADRNRVDEREAYTRARKLCRSCPVSQECLAHAQATREPHGLWGGLDPDERYELRQRRTRGIIREIAVA